MNPMGSLTRPRRSETTRKLGRGWLAILLCAAVGVVSGCATSGPNHVYVVTASSPAVQDLGPAGAPLPGILQPGEQAVGLAYDFNTDHLFVRVAPAQVIRVIERPSGKTLREMPLPPDLRTDRPADLATRSKDRHLFVLHPDGNAVVELSLFGEFIRRIGLSGVASPAGGLAYDQKNDRLLVLSADRSARIGAVEPNGHVTYYVTLAAAVDPVSLGYDSDAGHFFVPLNGASVLGEFDAAGNLVGTHTLDGKVTAVDAGPRAFVRVF